MQDHKPLKTSQGFESHINLREYYEKLLSNIRWFILSVIICLLAAFIYLRYAVPQYMATATILVKDERKGNMASEMTAFSDLGLMAGIKNNVDNEIEIIRSRTIVQAAVDSLDLNVAYFTQGRVKDIELYKNKPFEAVFFEKTKAFYEDGKGFFVKAVSDKKYALLDVREKEIGQFSYGSIVDMGYCKMILAPTALLPQMKDFEIKVRIRPLEVSVQSFKAKLNVETLSKTSSVVKLTMTDPVKDRAEDLINTIIDIYNKDAIADKNAVSAKTEKFINKRLRMLASELGDVERDEAGFMQSAGLTDIASDAGVFVQSSVDFRKLLIETETQLRIVADMRQFLESDKTELIPSNIIPDDLTASGLIAEHNKLVLDRDRYIKGGGTEENAVVVNARMRIGELRANIRESLARLLASLTIRRNDLQKQVNMVEGRISNLPRQKMQSRGIVRQKEIKEALYLYLLQKREEIAISLAVTAPNAKLIDSAVSPDYPISPKSFTIYIFALAAGLVVPFGILYGVDLLNTKIRSQRDVEAQVDVPFLGHIPRSLLADELISATSRSSFAEGLRIIRTNLEFLLGQVEPGKARTIAVTSTLSKEGKTFLAVNLANTIALTGKKVLLIGLDIRNPKFDRYIKVPGKGVTNYLLQANGSIADYVLPSGLSENLSVLPSGPIPPNPADLLMNPKMEQLFAEAKSQYDYVILDTAPVNLVTDTLLISRFADAFIYVIRANYLDKRMLRSVKTLYDEKRLPNMALLLNDSEIEKSYGYGYGYGGLSYGYASDEEKDKKPGFFDRFKFRK